MSSASKLRPGLFTARSTPVGPAAVPLPGARRSLAGLAADRAMPQAPFAGERPVNVSMALLRPKKSASSSKASM